MARAIPEDNLAYPVLVEAGACKGSGFYLRDDQALYFVTVRHVLYNGAAGTGTLHSQHVTLTSCSKDINEQVQTVWRVDLGTCQAGGNIRGHAVKDVAAVKLANVLTKQGSNFSCQFFNWVTRVSQAAGGFVSVSAADSLKRFNEVMIANDVYIFGYPSSLNLTPIPQLDHTRPLLRKGIVAGKNVHSQTIILDCPVFPGNSGGPAMEVERQGLSEILRVIGVVIEYVPCSVPMPLPVAGMGNSGYSVVEPMDHVLALVANW